MKANISNFIKGSKKYLLLYMFIIINVVIISDTFTKYDYIQNISTSNVNLKKAITALELTIEEEEEEDVVISAFTGIMSAYSADCVGCSGYVGCRPYPYVGDGNIYYNDATYGSVRIVAADMSIPCGTIMKITSAKLGEPIYAIVLDRGGSVGFGNKVQLDLLMDSSVSNLNSFGLDYNTNAQIIRYGW